MLNYKKYFKSSQLLVVGTHLDQCGDTDDKKHKTLCKQEKIVRDILHGCSAISVIERSKDKNTKVIHPIASKCDKDNNEAIRCRDEIAQEIRTAVESMSENDNVSKKVPISWLLFQYEIKLHGVHCILRSDCDQIAKNCHIDKDDVDDVLLFFHELGILLYYQDAEQKLSHVVFSEPQWLFAQLTKLIEVKYDPPYEAEESIKKGMFKKCFLHKIYEKEFDTKGVLHYEDIINLFVHLNIMARLSDVTEQYFMPALLNPVPNDISIDAEFGTKLFSTLCIKFEDGYFPRGVFCCLIALIVKINKTWKLQPNAAYKDLAVFQIESNEEYLILCDKIHYISVEIYCKEDLIQGKHQVFCCTLFEYLKEVTSTIHLNGEFKFGFLCKEKNCGKLAYVQDIQYPFCRETLICSICEHKSTMTLDQLVWFISPKIMDFLQKPSPSTLSSSYAQASQEDVNLSSHPSLLAQDAQMWELIKIVIPKIMSEWESLAYCMRYSPEEVEAFKKEQNLKERCKKLFTNWLTTDHDPKPKTYQILLEHIKEVEELTTASEAIEKELIEELRKKAT